MMDNSREALEAWVRLQYEGHQTPVSGEPYIEHILFVAELAGAFLPLGYEAGLCHDLLEDTTTTQTGFRTVLLRFGYSFEEINAIVNIVIELTDVFTKKVYPALRKKERKLKEAERLYTISPEAQTVKYADLVYNIRWTIRYQQKKALKYLESKKALLFRLDKGNPALREMALQEVEKGLTSYS